ncbi:MAG: hypothetical protein HQ557_03885 [Bacteroidetes bacterium]|nr:hypothetical protein [Bacteroidota bacterium]
MSKESKIMYKTIAILLSLLLFFGILSCNLDGPGIFLTISESTEIADSDLATEAVRDILYKDTNIMYILHGTSVKKADISAADPTWNNVAFSTPVSEAVFVPGTPHNLVYSSAHTADSFKSVYVGSFATPGSSTVVSGLENVNVIDIILDGTDVYAITYNIVSNEIEIYSININTTPKTSTLVGSFSSLVIPTTVHFIDNGGSKYFIFVYYDETKGFKNQYLAFPSFSTVTELTDSVFAVSDNAAKNSPIIGAYAYSGTINLVTNEGILITSTVINNIADTFTAVNAADSSEFMSIVLNTSGSTASVFFIPMTIVTKLDTTTELLIIGGLSDIYYYDIASTTEIPIEFSSTDTFYSNVSSTQILDF